MYCGPVSVTVRPKPVSRSWSPRQHSAGDAGRSGVDEGKSIDKPGGALTAYTVALIVKHHAEVAGPDAWEFTGHSLRSGFEFSGRGRCGCFAHDRAD